VECLALALAWLSTIHTKAWQRIMSSFYCILVVPIEGLLLFVTGYSFLSLLFWYSVEADYGLDMEKGELVNTQDILFFSVYNGTDSQH
jgi:hypothetical protein